MSPKQILLYCADEKLLSEAFVLLHTRLRVNVLQTRSAAGILMALKACEFRTVVIWRSASVHDVQVFEVLRLKDIPVVEVLGKQTPLGYGLWVHGNFPQNSADLLNTVKRSMARKRGPKKGYKVAA